MDKYQLPPVKETMSKVFTKYPMFELTEIVRQDSDNPLLEPLSILREDIDRGTSKFIYYINTNKKKINSNEDGYRVLDRKNFQKEMMLSFSDERFLSNLDYCRYIAYENDNIMTWNKLIRKTTNQHSTTDTEIINEDDVFTAYNTIVDEYLVPIITNSEDYIVDEVRPFVNEYDMQTYIVSFKNFYTGVVSRSIQVINHLDEKTLITYYEKLRLLLEDAKYSHPSERKQKWKAYFDFKEAHLTMLAFTVYSKDNEKLGFVNKDISYGFGITVHKSQGSTYENTYVNVVNINNMFSKRYINIKMRNQLLYVALSRTSKLCNILI